MRVNLLQSYRGRLTDEEILQPGVQDVSKELGEHLLNKGYAMSMNSDTPDPVEEPQNGTVSSPVEEPQNGTVSSPVEDSQNQLRDIYKTLSGEDADKRWGIATLESKINDLR